MTAAARRRVSASTARRLHELTEPIAVVTYLADEPADAVVALGVGNGWDAYFAGRAAPFGREAPAEVVDALFYSFAPGEVARHIPRVWERVTPAAANAARQDGSVAALRRLLGAALDTPSVRRAGDTMLAAAAAAPTAGRALFAAVRSLPVPTEPVARLWHGANLLREHRGDSHVAALVTAGIGGTEAHVLHALALGMAAHEFGRIGHLPRAQLDAVVDGLRERGLVDAEGRFTDDGRQLKERIEALTDELAASAYATLEPTELDQLIADLEPLAATLVAAGMG